MPGDHRVARASGGHSGGRPGEGRQCDCQPLSRITPTQQTLRIRSFRSTTPTEGNGSVSKRGKSPTDAALDDLALFQRGRRDFDAGVIWDKNKPPLWQSGYRTAIRNKVRDFGPDMITLKQRLLIERAKPRFLDVTRRSTAPSAAAALPLKRGA